MGATKQAGKKDAHGIDLTKAQNGGIKKSQHSIRARATHESSEEDEIEDEDGEDESLGPDSEDEEEYQEESGYTDESGFQRVRLPEVPLGTRLIKQKVFVAKSTHDLEFGSENTVIGIYDHLDDANGAAQAWLPSRWNIDFWESYEEHLDDGIFSASATGGEGESWEISVESDFLTLRVPDK